MANGTAPTTKDFLPSGVARLSYFYGQLLTQRDLDTEQRYHLELRRLLQREAFGTGTVAGLYVEDAFPTTNGSVFVRAGLAMDPDGRELLLLGDQCVPVAAAVASSAASSPAAQAIATAANPTTVPVGTTVLATTTAPATAMAAAVSAAWNVAMDATDIYSPDDPWSLWNRLVAAGLTEVGTAGTSYSALAAQLNLLTPSNPPATSPLEPGQLLRDYLFDNLVGTTYLGLQYAERGTEPSPTVLDASCCGNATCFPSRREEGVVIVAQHHPFHPLPDALEKLSDVLVQEENPASPASPSPASPGSAAKALCELVMHSWRGLPPEEPCHTRHLPVVPLARVYWSRFGRATGLSRILSVDNTCRPLAPGVPQVRALIDVLTQGTTLAPTAPRFDHISPRDHAQITVDTTTSPATATVTAQASSLLVTPIPAATWEIYYYPSPPTPPTPPTSSTPSHWNSANATPAGYPLTITLQWPTVTSATNQSVTAVQLVLTQAPTSGDGSTSPKFPPSGVYRWRLNIDGAIQALTTTAPVEGILEGVFYAP